MAFDVLIERGVAGTDSGLDQVDVGQAVSGAPAVFPGPRSGAVVGGAGRAREAHLLDGRLPARPPTAVGFVSLITEAMVASADPVAEAVRVRRGSRPRSVPPARRGGTCFAGWEPEEVYIFIDYLIARVGVAGTARLCGIHRSTVRKHMM